MPSAGDVERFAYCAHNWWLARHEGVDPRDAASAKGLESLKRIGASFHEAERVRREAKRGLAWSFRILGTVAALTLVIMTIVFFDATPEPIAFAYLATALVLLNCSAGLLTIALYEERRAHSIQREAGLVAGDVDAAAEVLHDPEWGLSGRVDYVLHAGSRTIPIVVKAGRTPTRPHFNHILQVACHIRLLEVRDGKAPDYGLLTYPQGIFRVAWDKETQAGLRGVLAQMAEAERVGRADRDHLHVGRCRGCARREACDQRLA